MDSQIDSQMDSQIDSQIDNQSEGQSDEKSDSKMIERKKIDSQLKRDSNSKIVTHDRGSTRSASARRREGDRFESRSVTTS